MFKPEQWGGSSCGNECTHKYSALMQIPWRVFCKKGCGADVETWEECLAECNEICYKDPVLKDQQWSAFIDRSPGAAYYSEECFNACRAGCGYKFEIPSEKVNQVHPNRPTKPPSPPLPKPSPPAAPDARAPSKSSTTTEDLLGASA